MQIPANPHGYWGNKIKKILRIIFASVVGETENTEISDESEPTEEQIKEEEEEEVIPDENSVSEDKPASEQEEQSSESEESEAEEPVAPAATFGTQTDSLEEASTAAESVILVKGVKTIQENDATKKELADLENAKIVYTDSCASADGSQVRKDTPVTFRILADKGYKVAAVKFASAAKTADKSAVDALNELTESQVTNSVSPSDDGIYTVAASNLADGKSILIAVELAETEFTISAAGNGTTVEMLKEDGKPAALENVKYTAAGSVVFAVSGQTAGFNYTVTAKTPSGEPKPLTGTHVDAVTGDNPVKEYWRYPLNILELDGVDGYADQQTITVTVTSTAAASVKASAATSTKGWNGSVAAAAVKADKTDYAAYSASASASYALGKKVAFTVTDDTNKSWDAVKKTQISAELVKDSDEKPLTVMDMPADDLEAAPAEGTKAYFVTLPATLDDGYTLKIDVAAEMAETVKKITVNAESDAQKVLTVTGGSTAQEAADANADKVTFGSTIKTDGDSYFLNIDSKEGYQLDKVMVKVAGKYTDSTVTETFPSNYEYDLIEDEDTPVYTVTGKEIELTGTGTPGKTPADTNAWEATAVTVTISVKAIEGAEEDKEVTITSESAAEKVPYTYTVADGENENGKITLQSGYKADDATRAYDIAEGTKVLSFTVKAKTTPSVTVDRVAESANKDLVVEQSGDQWTYTIPAKVLKTDAHITITRDKRTVTLNKGTSTAAVKWSYQNAEDEDTDLKNQALNTPVNVDVDEELKINVDKVTGIGNAPIGTVTYKVGDGAETPVTPDSDGNYEFVVTASENIAITVTSVADARLFVENEAMEDNDDGIKELKNGEKVVVGYEKPTTAYLKNGKDQKMKLLNATVTENGKLAQTKAEIQNGTDAVIENVAKSEQGAELEVTLMTADRATMSFTLVSDKAVDDDSEIKFTDEEGNPVKDISLNANTKQTVYVNAASGTISKLACAVINTPADGVALPADAKSEKEDAKFIPYLSTTGKLTITADPEKDAISNAGTIVLYERNDPDKKIIKGSDLKVSIGAPIMKGRASKISVEANKVTLRNIPVTVAVENEVRGERDILSGEKSDRIGYQFKVSYTEPAATKPADYNGTQEEWDAFKASVTSFLGAYKSTDGVFFDVAEIGEGLDIKISDRNVKAYPLSDLKVQARAVQFDEDGTLIANGDWCTEVPVTIPAPFYSDTLKLGRGESAVATGQDRDVVVATPEFNTKENERYKYVEVEIINKKTGLAHVYAGDFQCGYNTLTGEVWVNAAGASYANNVSGYYADLAVKVTAFTEKGDYGVSGVKALKVENGLEDITVDMQADILKDGTLAKPAKVTVKPVVTFNYSNGNKKYEPAAKYKKVTYAIVGSDSDGYNEYYEGSPLSKAMQEAVDSGDVSIDAKGTITLAKDFIPKDGVEYKFKVLVKADDPLNNKEVQNVSDEVAIINKPMETGVVGIFEKQYKNYQYQYKLITSGVNSGTVELPVTQTSGQYRLAMIRPGITRTGDVYRESDLVDPDRLLLSSSNKKNVDVDEDGDITVNKLGKINFTVKVESNSKRQTETVKNINFTMENTPLYAKLTKYQDASFAVAEKTEIYQVVGGKTEKFVTSGNETGYYTVELVKLVEDVPVGFTLPNYSYSYKKAKDVTATRYSNKDTVNLLKSQGKAYVLVSGSGTGKNAPAITVTNKQAKPAAKMEIQIENTTAATGAAPKLALKDKKQKVYADDILNTVDVTVTTGNKKGLEMPDDAYIMLTADWTKKVKNSYNNVFSGELDKVIPVHRTGTYMGEFSIDMRSDVAENYTLIASLGTMDNGVFTQTYKDARITLKTTKVNTSLKVNPTSFTLNPYGVSKRVMTVKSGNDRYRFEDRIRTKVGADTQGDMFVYNYAQNQIQANGEPNAFNQCFIVTDQKIEKDENGLYARDEYNDNFYIMINPNLTDKQLENLASTDFMKKNGTGYVTVSNYYGDNKYGVKVDQKITVKIDNQDKLKLTATADPVLTGTAGTVTDIYVKNGKEAVALEDYTVESADFEKYYSTAIKDVIVEEREDGTKVTEKDLEEERLEKGIIRVKTKTADTATGKKDVTINVLPADTVDCLRATVDNKDWMARGTGKKLGVKISVEKKDASQKINVDKNNKLWVVKGQDWVDEGTGWATQIEYSFKNRLNVANGQKIKFASETDYVYFGQDLSETEHNMEKYNTNDVQRVCIYLDKSGLEEAIKKEPKKLKWGKKITVKANLTFPGEGADAKDLPIKTDKLSIDITLPAEPGFDDAAGLSQAVEENKAMLQKFVESRTQFYLNQDKYNNNNYWQNHMNDLAMVVEGELRDKVLGLSQGTTAVIEAKDEQGKWDSANHMFTFPLKVDKDSWAFYVYYGNSGVNTGNAQTIANKAASYGADKLNLQFYPEFTTSADLTSQLTAHLKTDNALPNNVVLTATVDKENSTAPKVGQDGYLYADITVVNKNCTPGSNNNYQYTRNATYTFTQLKDLIPYLTGDNSLKKKLEAAETAGAYKDASKMTAIFGAAYTKEEYIDDDNEVQDDMLTGIQNAIEEYAKDLAEESENPYLEVTGVSGLTCTYGATAADNAEGWSVKFKIAYADHTPQSQTPAPSYEITLPVKKADVKSMEQSVDEVKAAAESLFEKDNYLIHAETEPVATEAVKAMINEACVGYDKAKIDVKRENGQQFTAPTDEVNGKLELTVKYSDSISKTYTFILVKKLTDGELPDLNERAKAVDLVKATMTEEKVNEMVVKAWNEYWKNATGTFDTMKFDVNVTELKDTAIKGGLNAVLKAAFGADTKVLVDSVAIAEITSGQSDINYPKNSTATGKIGDITITMTDTTANADAWEDADKTITVKSVTLTKNDCFQDEADYKTKVEKALTETGIAYDGSWFTDGNLTTDENGVTDTVKNGIKAAITSTLTDALADKAILLNPQWAKKYASDVTAAPQADSVYANTSVSKVLLKWTTGEAGKEISVKIRGLQDMDWITKVEIVSASDGTKTFEVKGEDPDKAITIDNFTEDKTFELKANVYGTKDDKTPIEKDVTWAIMKADGTTAGARKDLIEITDENKLFISKDAALTDEDDDTNGVTNLTLVATADGDVETEDSEANVAKVTLKITLKETVDGVVLKVDDAVVPDNAVYVAPAADDADGEKTVTFTAAAFGTHLKEATKSDVVITSTLPEAGDDEKLIFTNDTLTMKPGAEDATVTLTFKNAEGAALGRTNTKSIQVKGNAGVEDAVTLGLTDVENEAKFDKANAKPATLVISNQEAKDVYVPINLQNGAGLAWTYEVDQDITTGNAAAINDFATLVTCTDRNGKLKGDWLKISNDLPEVFAKQDANADKQQEKIDPTVVTLTATGSGNGAEVVKKLSFELVVNKNITEVKIQASDTNADSVADVNDPKYEVTVNGDTRVYLKAVVTGAHVSATGDDQKVTWSIESKAKGSKASLETKKSSATTVLTIPADSPDNIIKIKAVSEADKAGEGETPAETTITIKVNKTE